MDMEELKTFFETDEGKAFAEELKTPLINKRNELMGELTSAKDVIKQFNATKEENERIIAEKASEAEKEKLKSSGDFDAYKLFHEDEVGKYKREVSDLKNQYAGTEVSRLITEIAAKHSTSSKPLQLLLRERVSGSYNEEGKFEVSVKGEDGQPMYYEGNPASIDHLVASLKSNEEYGSFFSASGASGSGTHQNETAPANGNYKDMESDDFNLTKAMGNK